MRSGVTGYGFAKIVSRRFYRLESVGSALSGSKRIAGAGIDLEACALRRGPRSEFAGLEGHFAGKRDTSWSSACPSFAGAHRPRCISLFDSPGGNMCRGNCVTRGTHIVRQEKCASGPTAEPVITTSQHPADRGPRERNDMGISCRQAQRLKKIY